MIWYGLTREEAEARCRELKAECRFTVTRDPKAVSASDDSAVAAGVPKVIRVKEEDGVMCFLLGYFTPGLREFNRDG